MIRLHAHNLITYNRLVELFTVHPRAACVQPTGTGKSFIVLRLIEDNPDKKFIIGSPSVYIEGQMRVHAENNGVNLENVEFITYTKLAQLSDDEINSIECDYIVLDEFHRCGAVEWGSGVERLLNTHENALVLGTSATPIRYLDNYRNMAEEIFNNVYAVNMSLVEAINKKILPLPVYVTALYSFSGDIERLRLRAERSKNPRLKRTLLGKVSEAKRKIAEIDCGVDKIFEKHIVNKNGKYIIFCPGVEKLQDSMLECDVWFKNVNKSIHKYAVYHENYNSHNEFDNFKNDNDSNALKLLFCVDMLNEGVHIEGVEGVIMLRATKSANVFYQQLGRALVCGSKETKHPLIFDIVNNYETGDTGDTYAQIMELHRENGKSIYGEIEFELYDYVQDIRTILNELKASFENEWDSVFEAVCEFKETNNRFPLYDERYDGLRIGVWCSTQRALYKKNKLATERAEKLNSIGFEWSNRFDIWNGNFDRVVEFKNKNNRLPNSNDTDEDAAELYFWLTRQKSNYKQNLLADEKAQRLVDLGVTLTKDINVKIPWQDMFESLKCFVEENNRFPNKDDTDNKRLYIWANTQRTDYRKNKLDENKIKQLNSINFPWDMQLEIWNNTYNLVKEYISEFGNPPSRHTKFKNKGIGQWYIKQVNAYNENALDDYKKTQLEALGVPLAKEKDAKPERHWISCYDKLKIFIDTNNRLPKSREKYEGINLYDWLIRQKRLSSSGKLTSDHRHQLLEINIDIDKFASR